MIQIPKEMELEKSSNINLLAISDWALLYQIWHNPKFYQVQVKKLKIKKKKFKSLCFAS